MQANAHHSIQIHSHQFDVAAIALHRRPDQLDNLGDAFRDALAITLCRLRRDRLSLPDIVPILVEPLAPGHHVACARVQSPPVI